MGVQESQEDAQETFQSLMSLSDAVFESVLAQLENISKTKYDMQISKWDLMQVMSTLSSIQIKKIMQVITRKPEPNTVGIHPLEIALVLCRKELSRAEKVKRIFSLVCYEVSPGRIQFSEVDYVFHLIYNWIRATTGLELQTCTIHEATRQRLYDKNKETVSLEEVIVWVGKYEEIDPIFAIFTKPPRAQLPDFKPSMVTTSLRPAVHQHFDAATGLLNQNPSTLSRGSRGDIGRQSQTSEIMKGQLKSPVASSSHEKGASQFNKAKSQTKKAAAATATSPTQSAAAAASAEVKSGDGKSVKDGGDGKSVTSPRVLVTEYAQNLKQPQKQLLWNAKILAQMNHMFKEIDPKKEQVTPSIQLKQMQDKLTCLKEMGQLLEEDRVSNLIDLNNKFDLIETTNMEFYGQRQLTFMMRSLFYEKELVNAKYSIVNFVKCPMKSLFEDDQSINELETIEGAKFKEVMMRAQMAKSFKEFYRQNLSEVKYELQMHQTRLMQMLSSRGTRRIYEKKKYKCLGEINMITKILAEIRRRKKAKKASEIAAKNARFNVQAPASKDSFRGFIDIGGSGPLGDSGKHERSSESLLKSPRNVDKKKEDKALIPDPDWFYNLIYKELDQLRSSGMSRKDFIELVVQKNEKTKSVRTSSFLEGALASLRYVNQVSTFKEMVEFSEFLQLTEKVAHEENRVQKNHTNSRQQTKENCNEFCSQLGKLKGLHFIMQQIQHLGPNDEKELVSVLKRRLQDLFSRLEGIDVQLVKTIEESIVKKRSSKLYFMALGKLAVYKCISKGLKPAFLTNYLAIALSKFRILELFELISNQNAFVKEEVKESVFAELNGDFFKMLKQVEIDKYFNLEINSTDSSINFDKFQDDMIQIAEDERQQAAMAQFQQERASEENATVASRSTIEPPVDDLVTTVTEMMTKYLSYHRRDKNRVSQFSDFAQRELGSKATVLLPKQEDTPQQAALNELISQSSGAFFEFVDLEDVFEKDDEQFTAMIKHLRSLSTTLQQTDFEYPMQRMLSGLLIAHTECRNYALEMQKFSEPSYIEQFKAGRFKTFDHFMKSLRKANRGNLINNFNMYLMSIPQEFSMRNNFWLAYALSAQLDFAEKEEKFNVLLQTSSNEMNMRRNGKLGASEDFHPNLTMSCFWQQQSCLFSNRKVSTTEKPQVNQVRDEFEKQYTAIKGGSHRDFRIRQTLFADLANYFHAKATTRSVFLEVIDGVLEMRSKVRDLKHLQSILYDHVYRNEEGSNDLKTLIQKHLELKMKVTDRDRHSSITGILKGAEEFVNLIIENQHEAGNEESEASRTLQTLKAQIASIMKTHCQKEEEKKNVSKNAQPSTISLVFHSRATEETDGPSPQKKSVPKSAIKGMLEKAQEKIVRQVTQTHCFYKLIGQANQSLNLFQFFDDIEILRGSLVEEVQRRSSISEYLMLNGLIREQDEEFLGTHIKELGARIVQDMLAGLTISSTFAYQPFEEQDFKPEPVIDIKSSIQSKKSLTSPKGSSSSKKSFTKGNKSRQNSTRVSKDAAAAEETKTEVLSQVPELRKSIQSVNLSNNEIAVNLTLNFLNEICIMDDKLTAKQILKNNRFFSYLQVARVILDSNLAQFNLTENLQLGLSRLLNVFEVQNTPLKRYLINFERITKFIQQELVPQIQSTDESHLKFFFFDIMSKKGSALVKQTINKVETYFSLAELKDEDKLSFSTAQTKIKRDLDQNLRTFKEFIDLEDNKKVAKRHQSMIKHQELRLMHEVASLLLLVRTYYLKQNPTSKPGMLNQLRGEQPF